MDLLNCAIGLHARNGGDAPEADRPQLATPGSAVACLESRLAAPEPR